MWSAARNAAFRRSVAHATTEWKIRLGLPKQGSIGTWCECLPWSGGCRACTLVVFRTFCSNDRSNGIAARIKQCRTDATTQMSLFVQQLRKTVLQNGFEVSD